jgi:hypothetical protein
MTRDTSTTTRTVNRASLDSSFDPHGVRAVLGIRSTVVGPVAPPHRTSDTVATVFFRVGRWGWCRYAARNIRTIITDDRSALELLNIEHQTSPDRTVTTMLKFKGPSSNCRYRITPQVQWRAQLLC